MTSIASAVSLWIGLEDTFSHLLAKSSTGELLLVMFFVLAIISNIIAVSLIRKAMRKIYKIIGYIGTCISTAPILLLVVGVVVGQNLY